MLKMVGQLPGHNLSQLTNGNLICELDPQSLKIREKRESLTDVKPTDVQATEVETWKTESDSGKYCCVYLFILPS